MPLWPPDFIPPRIPGATYRQDFFTGRALVTGADPETLAQAYAAGYSGFPLDGRLWEIAVNFNLGRREPFEAACFLSEGADNAVVDWFCQGVRDRYADDGRPVATATAHSRGPHGEWQSHPIAMLWNIEERPALTNEAEVRALIDGPQLQLPAPTTAADLLRIGGPNDGNP